MVSSVCIFAVCALSKSNLLLRIGLMKLLLAMIEDSDILDSRGLQIEKNEVEQSNGS